jgi:hypothetical protein
MALSRALTESEAERRRDWDLLVRACRVGVGDLGARVSERFPESRAADWAGFLQLMDQQGAGPIAASALLSLDADLIPEDVRGTLQEKIQLGRLRAGILVEELLAILDAFENRGIAAIAHKGPALSMLAYGRVGVRDSFDLDLVVGELDVSAAEEALRERGYERHDTPPLTPRQEAARRRTWNEYELVSRDGWLFVDLHWRVCPPRYPFRIDPGRLWSRLARVPVGGREVRAFSAETQVVLLCLHGAKDRWHRLVWLCDVDRLVRGTASLPWEEVRTFAEESRCRRALGLGLLLAHRLLGTPLPPPILEWLAEDRSLERLAARVADRLATGGMGRSWRWELFDVWPFHLEVFDGWRDGVLYLGRALVTPVFWDWQRVPLPDRLYPLYHVVRPLRLFAALVRKSVRRSEE